MGSTKSRTLSRMLACFPSREKFFRVGGGEILSAACTGDTTSFPRLNYLLAVRAAR